jgi:hypothetical protein
LKASDVLALTAAEQKIAKFATDMKTGDAALSPEDRAQLTVMLNDTDCVIYPQKASADAKACPPMNHALLAKLFGSDFTRQDAEELCAQMQRVYQLKSCLGQDPTVTGMVRTEFIQEYNDLNAILHS